MKKLFLSLILIVFISNSVLADCDFKTGITQLPNGNYEYTKACHIKVGQLVQDNATKTQQVADLTKAITLKDLAIKYSDDRATLWSNTSSQLEERLQKVDSLERKNDWLFFGLGVLTTIGAGFMAARLMNH